ncbi:MAG: Rpn family recombination-promoting nuclease/putative transposase [Treponema sp.]|nr:Rpn family recombination-promoting nuclease/putative transposase [Treponema sp.]
MNVNRELKNSVFTTLFNDEDKVRELYAALKGVDYDPNLPVVITTLRDVLYMNRINDLSFTAEQKMALIIEHQSSLNHNMPLRILLYMSRVYEKIVDRKSLYKEALVKIPRPEFIVLYNGADKTPDKWEERLSEAYMEAALNPNISLDLTVTVYNINKDRNQALLSRSKHLAGYAEFVARVRENENAMPPDQAVTEAVRRCIRDGILADFLEEHGSEVMNMLLEEWNWDEAKEVWREEAWEKGWEEGREEGIEKGWEEGREKGREEGIEKGMEEERNQVLELIKRGYTTEQIAAELSEDRRDRRR